MGHIAHFVAGAECYGLRYFRIPPLSRGAELRGVRRVAGKRVLTARIAACGVIEIACKRGPANGRSDGRPVGRPGGRAGGRTDGRADGRADGRTDGRGRGATGLYG